MKSELSIVLTLRKVLELARDGKGVAGSLVRELGGAEVPGKEVARRVLTGFPIESSLLPLLAGDSREVAMLASIVVASAKSSSALAGRNGELLSYTLERWVKARENRRLEEKVLGFRGFIVSGVLGAVSGMVAALGPVLGALDFSRAQAQADPGSLTYAAAAMVILSSVFLGLSMSRRKFYLNVFVAALAFLAVLYMISPLVSLSAGLPWGIK